MSEPSGAWCHPLSHFLESFSNIHIFHALSNQVTFPLARGEEGRGARRPAVCVAVWRTAKVGAVMLRGHRDAFSSWHPGVLTVAVGASSQHRCPRKPLLTCFLSPDQSGTPASRPGHPAPAAELPVSLPAPASRAGSLFGCLPDGSSHVGLLAQSLCWEHTDGSGKAGPLQAGLGQLNRVNGRHLPGHQEKGTWVHPGEGGLRGGKGATAERSVLHPLPGALHQGPTAPGT